MARAALSRRVMRALRGASRIEHFEPRVMLAAPDLTASIVSLDAIAARGHSVKVDYLITNVGDAPINQNWYDRVWLSPTSTFDSKSAIEIGTWWSGGAFAQPLAPAPGPGNSYQISRNSFIPADLAVGNYFLFVEADALSYVAESNENNNLSLAGSFSVIAPDIAMTSATITNPASAIITWGQTIDVSFTVTNNTAARLDNYWYDTVNVSKDNKLDDTDWTIQYIVYEALPAHGSYTHQTQVRIDGPWALSAGPGHLVFIANNVNWSSPDADLSDNALFIPITILAPDLEVSTSGLDDNGTPITGASNVPTGTLVNVSWTVENTGDSMANAPWADSVYISKKNVFDNAAQWQGYIDPPEGTIPLSPAGTYTQSYTLDITSYDGGQYYLYIRTDSNWALMEASDDNNVGLAMPLHLVAPATKPDLTASNLSVVPNEGNVGTDTLTITYDVHNIDPANSTTADYWYDILWLSRTSTFDRATALWAYTIWDNPPVLGPGGVYTNTVNIPFPSNVGLGDYYVFVEVDAFNWQQETNGNNNITTQNNVPLTIHGADFRTDSASIDNGSGDPNSNRINVGAPFTINWHVNNNGDIETPADWIDAIYITDQWHLDETAIKIAEFSSQSLGLTSPIAPGGGYDASMAITIPAWMGAGEKKLFIVSGIQSTGDGLYNSIHYQPDPDIYNNGYGAVQIQLQMADLTVTSAKSETTIANVGDYVTIELGVTNNGEAGVPAGWTDSIYISPYSTFSKETARQIIWFTHNFEMSGGGGYSTAVDLNTAGLDGGDFFIFVVTDADNVVGESNESNNVSAPIPLTLIADPGLPDLRAGIVSVLPAPAIGNIGESYIEIEYTIENISFEPTNGGSWIDRIWLSPSAVFNPATAISLGDFWNEAPILHGEDSYTYIANVMLPANFGIGTFYLFVEADFSGSQMETDAGNNISSPAVPVEMSGMDLVVDEVTFNNFNWDPNNRQLIMNQVFELGWKVENQGNAESTHYWMDAIYISDSPIWDPETARLVTIFDTYGYLPLEPSDFHETNQQLSLPGWVGTGMHFLFVVSGIQPNEYPSSSFGNGEGDLINFAPDADYSSNVSAPIRVHVGKPNVDLTVSINYAPTTVTLGQYANEAVEWTVFNNGPDSANGITNNSVFENWTDNLYITQTPEDSSSYILLHSYDTGYTGNTPLWGNSSYSTSTYSLYIPFDIVPGEWFFVLVTDVYNDQGETSESNNTAIFPVRILAPDLTVVDVTATPIAGPVGETTLNVAWTVHNGGDGDAIGDWYDQIYVSSSPVFDESAQMLTWSYHAGGLLVGQSYIASSAVTLPAGMVSGIHYIYVKADGFSYLPEINKNNNASAGFAIDLGGGPPAIISGTDAPDTLYLRRLIGGNAIEVFLNTPTTGAPTWIYGLVNSITFNGLGGNDQLILDFSNGSPIPSGGLSFDGGNNADAIVLTGLVNSQSLQVQPSQILVGALAVAPTNVESVALDGTIGSVVNLSSLTLAAALTLTSGKGLILRTGALSITAPGSLNLADGRMILDYTGATPAQTARGWLANGAIGATPAIVGASTLAIMDNARLHKTSYAGQTLASPFSQILIQPAISGDVNLNGVVDNEDLLAIFANLGRTSALWIQGDLDHNGVVNLSDLAVVQSVLPATSMSASSTLKTGASKQPKTVAKHKTHKVKIQKPRKPS